MVAGMQRLFLVGARYSLGISEYEIIQAKRQPPDVEIETQPYQRIQK